MAAIALASWRSRYAELKHGCSITGVRERLQRAWQSLSHNRLPVNGQD